MGTVYHHGIRYRMESLRNRVDMKSIAIMLSIEFMLYFFVIYKGFGWNYLPIIVFMMFFTIVSSAVASYMGADRYLLVIIILLLNLGFVVQEIESGNGVKISSFLLKFGLAVAAAFLAALLYKYLAGILIDDKIVLGIMTIQLLVCITMYTVGVRIGDMNRQGAVLTINVKGISITPFEIVKVLYLLVIAALLCKEESKMLYLGKWRIGKETFLMIHTGILSIFFLLCRELGTLLVIYLVEVIMLWIFGKNRKQIFMLLAFTVIGIGGVWFICDQILCPIVIAGKISLPGIMEKIVKRFGTAFHPEDAVLDAGYQGTMGLEALAIGGFLGLDTERYRLPLPEAATDMVFANVIQTCGFLMGVAIIVSFFALLARGIAIASACKETYFQGLTMSIVLLLVIENMIHIGYNIAMFPITGIPLYFVSQGFTAVVTAMVLAAVLLVISTGVLERRKLI